MNRSWIVLVVGCALLAGCGSPPKERYYTLSAPEAAAGAGAAKAAFTVAVGPVTVPAMVDRDEIVLRIDPNRVEVNEFNRWAEPLKRAIPRAVAARLAQQLADARVTVYPAGGGDVDYRVLIDVERFDSEPGKAVTVEASWWVRRGAAKEARAGRSVVRESASGAGYDPLVAAHSRALDSIAREIAEGLRTMSR